MGPVVIVRDGNMPRNVAAAISGSRNAGSAASAANRNQTECDRDGDRQRAGDGNHQGARRFGRGSQISRLMPRRKQAGAETASTARR